MPPSEPLAAHSESAALGVSQPKRLRAELLVEDPILLSQVVDQILLVTVQPSSEGEDEELQSMGHRPRLRRQDSAKTGPCLDESAASADLLHPTGTGIRDSSTQWRSSAESGSVGLKLTVPSGARPIRDASRPIRVTYRTSRRPLVPLRAD